MDNIREKVKELTLALLYLTSWEEKEYGESHQRSWKGYPFEILDELNDEGLIYGSKRAKSVYINKEGIKKALDILKAYEIEDKDKNEKG